MPGENYRTLPTSELDLNLMLTDSLWGKDNVPEGLKDQLKQIFAKQTEDGKLITDKDGNIMVSESSLWGLLGFYTRDMRLGNLSNFNNELQSCRYMIDLANDFLTVKMIRPFLICLSRAATILETSQSKGGFLRRIMNTLTHERINKEFEPSKKEFFGGNKNKKNGGWE